MSPDSQYMVFREYRADERKDWKDRTIFYGWSKSKAVVDAFMAQRNPKKYSVKKMSLEQIADVYSDTMIDQDRMINYVMLESAKTGENVPFFTTASELQETEKKIQRYFADLSSFGKYENAMEMIQLFVHLKDVYYNALVTIGFRPKEVDYLFPSANDADSLNDIEGTIDNISLGYDSRIDSISRRNHQIPGTFEITEISKLLIYSLESFIKILKEDL